jgi:hypothetical protein
MRTQMVPARAILDIAEGGAVPPLPARRTQPLALMCVSLAVLHTQKRKGSLIIEEAGG